MSVNHEFYLEQARKARSDADAATLDNVRERCLRSEAAWTEMATRAARNEVSRAKTAAEKAARQDDFDGEVAALIS